MKWQLYKYLRYTKYLVTGGGTYEGRGEGWRTWGPAFVKCSLAIRFQCLRKFHHMISFSIREEKN